MISFSLPTAAQTAGTRLYGCVPAWIVPILLLSTFVVLYSFLYLFPVPMGGVVHPAIVNTVVLFFLLIIPALSIARGLHGVTRNDSRRSPFSPGSPIILLFLNYNQHGISATPMGISSLFRSRAGMAR